jgi:hypothetical protein
MLIEFALQVLPPLRPSIEVNANLIWECLIDYSRGRVCYGFVHIAGFHKGCVRTTSSLRWLSNVAASTAIVLLLK